MSSPKNINMALLDIGLKHNLKNWASRNRPPADAKKQLLLRAAHISRRVKARKASSFIFWLFGVNHADLYYKIYHERLRLKELLYSQCAVRLY